MTDRNPDDHLIPGWSPPIEEPEETDDDAIFFPGEASTGPDDV